MSQAIRKPHLRLRLYIAGPGAYAMAAQRNLERVATAASIEYELEVIDLRRNPERAAQDSVVVTPTLVRAAPPPRAMLIGDLADESKLAAALGVQAR